MKSRSLSRSTVLAMLAVLVYVAPPAHGQTHADNSAEKPTAHMNITYYDGLGGYLDGWSAPVVWTSKIPAEFHGAVDGQNIQWIGVKPKKDSIRVMTTSKGKGGKRLPRVMPAGTGGISVVVTSLSSATGDSKAPRARSRRSPTSEKKSKPRPFRPRQAVRRQRRPPTTHRQHRKRRTSTMSRTTTRRPRQTPRSAATGDAPSVKNKRHSDKPASMGDGADQRERARDARVTGTGNLKGTEGGEVDGKPGGSTREQGGMDAPNATARGKGTAAHGMKGGTGPNSAQGIPAGGGIFPLITVPASLRHLTDTLLILKDANPGQLASNWMAKITSRTTVYRLRKNLARKASKYADARLAQHADEIAEALRTLSKRERTMMNNRWRWEIQRQYFARVERGAASKVRKATTAAERTSRETPGGRQGPPHGRTATAQPQICRSGVST